MKVFTFGLIRLHCQQVGWRLSDLAARLGITRQAVGAWEKSGVPDDQLQTVLVLLKISQDDWIKAVKSDAELKVKTLLAS